MYWRLIGCSIGKMHFLTQKIHTTSCTFLSLLICVLTEFVTGILVTQRVCTFETGLCGWKVSTDASRTATWIRWRGPPHQTSSHLNSDHTTQTSRGHYLYMTTSHAAIDHVAVLQGVPFVVQSKNMKICNISFWCHIKGNASLNLSLITPTQSYTSVIYSKGIPVYKSIMKDTMWHYVIESAPSVVNDTVGHVEFFAVMHGTSDSVTVALDDITYLPCSSMFIYIKVNHT